MHQIIEFSIFFKNWWWFFYYNSNSEISVKYFTVSESVLEKGQNIYCHQSNRYRYADVYEVDSLFIYLKFIMMLNSVANTHAIWKANPWRKEILHRSRLTTSYNWSFCLNNRNCYLQMMSSMKTISAKWKSRPRIFRNYWN